MIISYVLILPVVVGLVLNPRVPGEVWLPVAITVAVLAALVQMWQ